MPKFQLLPGARGMDFPDGRSMQADKHGRVEVDDVTARQIKGSAAYRRYDGMFQVAEGRFFPTTNSPSCGCNFTPWPWQTVCPKCGASLENLRP
jgi:hypothetical protein